MYKCVGGGYTSFFSWIFTAGEPATQLACQHTHSNSESVGCKIKTSFSFSKPRCFAYTTLSYITVIMAVIMAPNSKMRFRGKGVMEEVAAGRQRDSGGSGGGKWLHWGEQAGGNLETNSTWNWTEDCIKTYHQGVIYMCVFVCLRLQASDWSRCRGGEVRCDWVRAKV